MASRPQIVRAPSFETSFRKLVRSYGKETSHAAAFTERVEGLLVSLTLNPRPSQSRPEPWPAKAHREGVDFRKVTFDVPHRHGAAQRGRLMYLVENSGIRPLWIYTHEQYEKRPPPKSISRAIRDALEANGPLTRDLDPEG